jgi:hypothetical protein
LESTQVTISAITGSDGNAFFSPNPSGYDPGSSIGECTTGPAAAIGGIATILSAAHAQSIMYQVQDAFNALKPQADATIANANSNDPDGKCYDSSVVVASGTGCIVIAYCYSSNIGDDNQQNYGFLQLALGDCGPDYQTALKSTLSQVSVGPAPPPDSSSMNIFMWYMTE